MPVQQDLTPYPDPAVKVLDPRFAHCRLNNAAGERLATGFRWTEGPVWSDYEGRRADFELPTAVYRLDPDTGTATAVLTDLQRPNGLCFSPDETRLYVVDSGPKPGIIAVYHVTDGKLGPWSSFRGHEPRWIGRHPVRR